MTITAIIGDTRSIGTSAAIGAPQTATQRLNPQVAVARIRTVTNPHITSDAIGGLISADFLIPAWEALLHKPLLRYGAVCWLFDGATPIFQGWLEQPVWTITGDCQVTVSGAWVLLGTARMREAWDLWDMSLLTKGTGANENKAGQVNLNSDGSLTLSIPAGVIANSDRCSVDFLLFGEVVGPSDGKLITAFEFDVTDVLNMGATRRLRVIGKANAAAGTGDQLWDAAATAGASGRQGAQNLHSANQGGVPWPNADGYRCLRFEIIATAGATIAADWYATFDRIRIGTREAMFPAAAATLDTASIARDILGAQETFSAGNGIVGQRLPPEFWRSALNLVGGDTDTFPYLWGLDPITGTGSAPNSGIGVTGFNALEWQSPADLLAALAQIDGNNVGFYLPYNGRTGYDPPGSATKDVGSFWLSAPPQLCYQPFNDPVANPDYTIHTLEGANYQANADAQPLTNVLYTNWNTLRGRQQSVVVSDTTTTNYAYAQGFRRSDDYTIQPAIGDQTLATSLAGQVLSLRRQPTATATVTITNAGANRNTGLLKNGSTIPHLATVRPGSCRLADGAGVHGSTAAGYVTHIEWYGATLATPERLELSLSIPGQMNLDRRLGRVALREAGRRVKIL